MARPGSDGGGDGVTFIDQLAQDRAQDRSTVTGEVKRGEFRRGVAAVLMVAVVLIGWAVSRAPSAETDESADQLAPSDSASTAAPAEDPDLDNRESEDGDPDTPDPDAGGSAIDGTAGLGDDLETTPRANRPEAVDLGQLEAGSRVLYVSDGDDLEQIDLSTGARQRWKDLGVPIVVQGDRLYLYQRGVIYSLPRDNLGAIPFNLTRVDEPEAVLWSVFAGDRPKPTLSFDGQAVWWPAAGSEIRWRKIRLSDGAVIDDVVLQAAVGGPEIAPAIGSGIYQRIDREWVKQSEGYVYLVGAEHAIGYSCDNPAECRPIAYDVGTGQQIPLAVDMDDMARYRLIDGTDRVLGISDAGIHDLESGERVAERTWTGSPTATAAGQVVAISHEGGIDLLNLDTESRATVTFDDFDPSTFLLVERGQ